MVRKKNKKVKYAPKETPLEKSYMTVKKDSLSHIFKDVILEDGRTSVDVLTDAIRRTNQIVFHTYNFLKLYCIHVYDSNLEFPKIDTTFIRCIIDIITTRSNHRGGQFKVNASTKPLKRFYKQYYLPLLDESDIVSKDSLSYVLAYEIVDIIKNIENNISIHYYSHLKRCIKVLSGYFKAVDDVNDNSDLTNVEKRNKLKYLSDVYKKLVLDVINVTDDTLLSATVNHPFILGIRKMFIPTKNSFRKNSVCYDVKCKPMDYLRSMICMDKRLGLENNRIRRENPDVEHPKLHKLFNALPLRTSIIPKYISLNTCALVSLFTHANKKYNLLNSFDVGADIWSKFFKTEQKSFRRKGYKFHSLVRTDGIACSISFIKTDKKGRTMQPSKKILREFEEHKYDAKYIHNVSITSAMRAKSIVTIDPGKSDLIKAMKVETEDEVIKMTGERFNQYKFFTYTQNKRKSDTRSGWYAKIRSKTKEEVINGKAITQIEEELSEFDSKTCSFGKFKSYLQQKIATNRLLYSHYEKKIYRKLKWNTYINTQRSESNMINRFKTEMGHPATTLVLIGDFSESSMKGKEPTITKKFRRMFRNAGYETYLLDEFRTSKLCHFCGHEQEHFAPRKKYDKEGKLIIPKKPLYVWKLLKCTHCKAIQNRDSNATKNMLKIAKSVMAGRGIPKEHIPPADFLIV